MTPASEQLRQEKEAFDQAKLHDALWFALKLVMGFAAVVVVVGIFGFCLYVALHPQIYGPTVAKVAIGTLPLQLVAAMAGIWRLVLSPKTQAPLKPITQARRRTSSPARRPLQTNGS